MMLVYWFCTLPLYCVCLLSLIYFVGVLRVSCIMVSFNLYVYFGLLTGLSPECRDSCLRHQADLHLPAEWTVSLGQRFAGHTWSLNQSIFTSHLLRCCRCLGLQTATWVPALAHPTVLCRLRTTMCGTLYHCTSNGTVTVWWEVCRESSRCWQAK